jgi:hypothetical protein
MCFWLILLIYFILLEVVYFARRLSYVSKLVSCLDWYNVWCLLFVYRYGNKLAELNGRND